MRPAALQGLDGEATERMVEQLTEPASEQQEPEAEFKVAAVLLESTPTGLKQQALPCHKILPSLSTIKLLKLPCVSLV